MPDSLSAPTMYLPNHFEEHRTEELCRLIADHPLGALVRHGPDGLDADHLPFLLDPSGGPYGHLIGHVARANPVCRTSRNGERVLVVFQGPQFYVSPNWYPSKQETHRHVPTWNYQVVHVHGELHLIDDREYLRSVVDRLTDTFEGRTASPTPWRVTDAPADYIERMLAAIVGVRIDIIAMVGKSKLSQNREERDRLGVIENLQARHNSTGVEAMKNAPPA